ncbi:hypothetical protein NP233_g5237 [Leucocoprinus birnbaumii]|uniref:Uncharacterized protein n=1 Tax=Leucocoprinus birnbaumii TaxID=56174 RepID=A0AAD5VUN3_9AGAR|nr:hypothetical protein NP233_g5237 [Leucocoprinus birnbaumii]
MVTGFNESMFGQCPRRSINQSSPNNSFPAPTCTRALNIPQFNFRCLPPRRINMSSPVMRVLRHEAHILGRILFYASESFAHHSQTLASVNRRWRQVATTCPGIWSHFHISADTEFPHDQGLELWISRSGDRPLHITLTSTDGDKSSKRPQLPGKEAHERCAKIIDRLTPLVERLTFLKVDFSNQASLAEAFKLLPLEKALQLKSVHATPCSDVEAEITMFGSISKIPDLKRLFWDAKRLSPGRSHTHIVKNFPFTNIVHLTLLQNCLWEQIFDVLKQVRNTVATATLWSQSLSGLPLNKMPSFEENQPRTFCPNLCVLNIASNTPDVLLLVANLHAPSLRVLNLQMDKTYGQHDLNDCYWKLGAFLCLASSEMEYQEINFFRLDISGVAPMGVLPRLLSSARQSAMASVEVILSEDDWDGGDVTEEKAIRREIREVDDMGVDIDAKFRVLPADEGGWVKLGWYDGPGVKRALEEAHCWVPNFELGDFPFNPALAQPPRRKTRRV